MTTLGAEGAAPSPALVHKTVENSRPRIVHHGSKLVPLCKYAAPLMLERIFDLYDDLERHRIMLSFKGGLSPELINAILNIIEHKLEVCEQDHRIRKRVFNVVMECLQNLYHHHAGTAATSTNGQMDDSASQGVVMIAQAETGYSVLTGNFMARKEVEALKHHLDHVNGCEPEQLRDLYKHTLGDGKFSRSGGGGLGIIDIARKSGRKLEYGFVPMDDDNAFFSLNVNVSP